MTTIAPDVQVDGGDWETVPDLEGMVGAALGAAGAACGLALMPGASVSVLLTDDARMREINRDWRHLDKPTNVLSFAALPPDRLAREAARAPFLGDIALAYETVRREAADEGKPFRDHATHLLVHGFLHLVGFDHETEAEAASMEALETRVLAGMGIPDPYGTDEQESAVPGSMAGGR